MPSELVDCPYCERRVMTTNGVCPGCNNNLEDTAASDLHVRKRDAMEKARAARAQGATLADIKRDLARNGLGEDLIQEIMPAVEEGTPEDQAVKTASDMRHALFWLVGGIVVSAVSFLMAASSENGGMYVIAYGAILTGGIQFLRAYLKSKEVR